MAYGLTEIGTGWRGDAGSKFQRGEEINGIGRELSKALTMM
jgi:hypothetical protein